MKEHDLTRIGIGPTQAKAIVERLTLEFVEAKCEQYDRLQIGWLTIADEAYPGRLVHTSQPPWVLYTIGEPSYLSHPSIAVVGTRTPSVYGRKVTADLATGLVEAGFAVVSGLARGIDGEAHAAALRRSGITIGVLGCPINQVYPREHAQLYRHMASNGVLVSEYPIGMAMKKGMFPMRNRIIAGLSRGVVVVEAAEKSGSLITADLAMNEGRDVFAVPGPVTSPKSMGTLNLLLQGAKPVAHAGHIVEDYQLRHLQSAAPAKRGRSSPDRLPADERRIYDLLVDEPSTVDNLLRHSQFTFGHLHSVLLSLTMKNYIRALPGSAYMAR